MKNLLMQLFRHYFSQYKDIIMSILIFPRKKVPLDEMTVDQLEDEKRYVQHEIDKSTNKITMADCDPEKEMGLIKMLRTINHLLLNK